MSAAIHFVRLSLACYLISVQIAMAVILVAYQWRENRFGFKPSPPRHYASFTGAALDGITVAGWIVLHAFVWPRFAYRALTHPDKPSGALP